MKIGEIARLTGLKIETVRFYEAEGLIPSPGRTSGNYRSYDHAQMKRLLFIRRARDLGFTLDNVRDLLRLADDPSGPCADVDSITLAHINEIDRKISDLEVLKGELEKRLKCCEGPTIANCRIIEALSSVSSLVSK